MKGNRRGFSRGLVFGIVLALVAVVFVGVPMNVSADFAGGDGSSGNPYQISTVEQLQDMNLDMDAHYILVNDIDASGTSSWNSGLGFAPVGSNNNRFTGSLDGQGYEISNLYIDRPSNYVGLFGITSIGAELENVVLEDVDLDGNYYVGGFVGINLLGTISNCHVTGEVTGIRGIGGLMGYNNQGTISTCYATVEVSGTSYYVGGLLGYNYYGSVSNSYATGVMSSSSHHVGGLVGKNTGGTISDCWATGDLSGTRDIGGLVGSNDGTVSNSYYCIDETEVNVESLITPYGIYQNQFDDWILNNKVLDIEDYLTKISRTNYYEISTVTDFKNMLSFATMDGYMFRQTADLDLVDESKLYVPIFNSDEYDGNGFSVLNLEVTNDVNENIGLFGINFGTISNCYLTGEVSSIASNVGGLVGQNSGGTISNCHATVEVSGTYEHTGGLVGNNHYGTISDCSAIGDVSGKSQLGGFVGRNFVGTISNSYAVGEVSSISSYVGGFVGTNYDGTISNCYATGLVSATGDYIGGFMGTDHYCTISDCYSTGEVSGNRYIGGLVGYKDYGSISNCYATGKVSSTSYYIGGLVGYNYRNCDISDCYATGIVSGSSYVGGLVGYNYHRTVSNSYTTGSVSGTDDCAGGLVGWNYKGKVENCYSAGAVTGNVLVGGLLGRTTFGTISECFATGDVSGTGDYVGGLVGYNYRGTVSNCYSTGDVSGPSNYVGGLVGRINTGTVSNCFWDTETSGMSSSAGGTGKTTAQMKDIATFTDTSTVGLTTAWDFMNDPNDDTGSEDNWDIYSLINDGYPFLGWQPNTPTGDDIEAHLGSGVTVTFDKVTTEGDTILTKVSGQPPANFQFWPTGTYYEIITNAEYEGNIQFTITYDDSGLAWWQELFLRLAYWDEVEEEWVDITTSVDTDNNILYGETTHLSIFTVMTLKSIPAEIDIDPDTLNLKSKGKWITCYIELHELFDVEDIDVDSIRLDAQEDLDVKKSDIQGDVLMVKFDRADVIEYLKGLGVQNNEEVELTVVGELEDDSPFMGSDTIRVLD